MINLAFLLIAFALVLMNAFFVAAEFGMVKLRHTRVEALKKTHGLRGEILAYVHEHLDVYLSACQLGITLASLGLGWVGEPAFARLLKPVFLFFQITSPELITVGSFFIAFTLLSFLHIVIGELLPKSLAIRQSEQVSLWTAIPLYGFYWLMYPAIWLLNTCAIFLLNLTGLGAFNRGEHFYLTDEIKLILSTSHLNGELTKDETEILEHTLVFADLKVTEIMRPREEMVMLDINQPMQTILDTVMEHRYSRYPVYDAKKQKIIGVIHVKDLFANLYQKGEITQLQPLLRPALKISRRLPALNLLRKFREGTSHFALVYRGSEILGFVTLDNLLHVLIGRIKDEFHRTQDDWITNPDGSLSVRGDCSIFALERALDRDIDIGPDQAETVVGLILNRLGGLPKENDKLEFKEFSLVVEKMRGYRVLKVKVIPKPLDDQD
ncbi:MAG: HlyC/CorC family transporter [Gammaproteobacteria bacterium]|nr:HlyC/CorC family transporter [Gammaproteobacteria bacterium]